MVRYQPLELLADVLGGLAATIGMMRHRVRCQIVITRASVTSWAVIAAFIDQPTTRREKRSTAAATKSQAVLTHT